jgi:hypothetical protein
MLIVYMIGWTSISGRFRLLLLPHIERKLSVCEVKFKAHLWKSAVKAAYCNRLSYIYQCPSIQLPLKAITHPPLPLPIRQSPHYNSMPPAKPDPGDIRGACKALATLLKDKAKYALVGGAACQLLGSDRATEDVDFVVPPGKVVSARQLIAADKSSFSVEPRTRHTHYKSDPQVEIEILSPPGTFREEFKEDTSTYTLDIEGISIEVLHPIQILNAKCQSILGRAGSGKKQTDSEDITFLLKWLAGQGITPTAQQVPHAVGEFVEWFISIYGGEELWTAAGFDREKGLFYLCYCSTLAKATSRFLLNCCIPRGESSN